MPENLQENCQQNVVTVTVQTLINCTLCVHYTPGQISPVCISAVKQIVMAEIWPPSWGLHSPDTWEDKARETK